jgi:hypothetical protein
MKLFWRDYQLETILSVVSVSGATLLFFIASHLPQGQREFISIANAGFLFVAAQIYGRLKDRRDSKRKRAQELFLEWHSKEIRESRIYLSRWRLIIQAQGNKIPSLGKLEEASASVYQARRQLFFKNSEGNHANNDKAGNVHELDNIELQEFHAFKIYQFFERWALLVKNNDIDFASANEYMQSYKDWWLDNFVCLWLESESDPYIKASLSKILLYLRPGRLCGKS